MFRNNSAPPFRLFAGCAEQPAEGAKKALVQLGTAVSGAAFTWWLWRDAQHVHLQHLWPHPLLRMGRPLDTIPP
jgi:hypothetical protein